MKTIQEQTESAFIVFWCMVLGLVIVLFCSVAHAETNKEIVHAIGHAENSVKFPYGIKSINTHGNKELARKICLNSVRSAKRRWVKAGRRGDFIVFMGKRYSPPKNNPNWVKLVRFYLRRP